MKESHGATAAMTALLMLAVGTGTGAAQEWWKPYSDPCTARENVFQFAEKPSVKLVGKDRYEIAFATRGFCDVTVGIIDEKRAVVRHLGSGVLGKNAPEPFRKNSLKQKIYWDGKDDLDAYPKEPGKLRVRVMLGLKPVFDKRLGGTSPRNLPGTVIGLAVGPKEAFVIIRGIGGEFSHGTIRKFDREGGYLAALVPPPSHLNEDKLGGMSWVEYEPGKRAIHGVQSQSTVAGGMWFMPPVSLDGDGKMTTRPVIVGDRLFFANAGATYGSPGSFLHYVYADGSTDVRGMQGIPLAPKDTVHATAILAASPDGRRMYLSGLEDRGRKDPGTCVYVIEPDGKEAGRIFAGKPRKPGHDNDHFSGAMGIDTDPQGRVYVADFGNNRIQVFSPAGKHLKTIKIDRPQRISVHKKTGAIYVQHVARVKGASVQRMTKLASFDNPAEKMHADGFPGLFALDSWSEQPRLWLSGRLGHAYGGHFGTTSKFEGSGSLTIWEEREKKFVKIADFETAARKEAGASWWGQWNGEGSSTKVGGRIACDPTREKVYYKFSHIFDLKTGNYEGQFTTIAGSMDDIAFDKRGYMHGRQGPGQDLFRSPAYAWRVDPNRVTETTDRNGLLKHYEECPYDYGVERKGTWKYLWHGALPLRDQHGAKGFQDGFGVNMRGRIAVESNIYYVPKMEEHGKELGLAGWSANIAMGRLNEEGNHYNRFIRSIKEAQKRGETVYFIRRQPGVPLAGATVWVFDSAGEKMTTMPAVPGDLLAGVQIDENNCVYFSMRRTKYVGGKKFLEGRGGRFGGAGGWNPFTGTYVKTRVDTFRLTEKRAIIPLDEVPDHPFDLTGRGGAWLEGIQWTWAGASPIVTGGCSCPSMRAHLDWYKRSFVPEAYRHSIAVLDGNGNVVMHLGRYGNFDSAPGGRQGCGPGDTDIGMTAARYIGGTDNYLAFEDWGERLVVLKLDYHAEETVSMSK